MQLTIDEITDADDGDYYCHAENSFGLATQPVSVRIRNTVLLIIIQKLKQFTGIIFRVVRLVNVKYLPTVFAACIE